ncbi:hypothetical protein [uncultured Nocardioides sp.]|uniref:hypothetical protein n=1 Tax=uncultured Nocardioides sp. TaxID=198441 RepID=UPI0026152FFF|nr:hypothetical protein [uncultured Nocardioides sp.]
MSDKKTARAARAFDVRTFIAALIGLYGVILLLTGIFGTSDADLAKADGLNVNLWTGLGLLAFAIAFQAWAMLRPVRVPPRKDPEQ